MSVAEITTLDIEPEGTARTAIIWMHGLGADAHDFEPIVPHLRIPAEFGLRFIFPNAPLRPVTINGGIEMRAWYDILSMDIPRVEDPTGVHDSDRIIRELIQREKERGIAADHIVLAGFSQGGAMALYTGLRYSERLAGILGLSCYVPLASTLAEERHVANQDIPLFLAHGIMDPMIPVHYGRAAAEQLTSLGYRIERHEYPMGHEVNWDEIQAMARWLNEILGGLN
jgi:phospholipase/carboxylesterase